MKWLRKLFGSDNSNEYRQDLDQKPKKEKVKSDTTRLCRHDFQLAKVEVPVCEHEFERYGNVWRQNPIDFGNEVKAIYKCKLCGKKKLENKNYPLLEY